MAWGAQTPLRFITQNPVTEAYDRRQKIQDDRALQEAQLANQDAQFSERIATAPSRLRQVNSVADLSESQARIQQQTEGNQIARSGFDTRAAGAGASRAETDADVAAKTAGYRVAQEQLRTEGAEITNRQAGVNLQQDQALFPSQLAQSQAGASAAQSQASSAASKAEQDQAWKEERFLDMAKVDPAQAEAWAAQAGLEVPPEMRQVIRDRRFMAVIDGLQAALKERYPADADVAVRAREFDRIFKSMLEDDTPTEAEAVGMVSQGTDTPSMPGTAGKGSEFERKHAAWLAVHPGDEQGALDYASGIKKATDAELWQSALKQANEMLKDDTGYLTEQDPNRRQQMLVQRATDLYGAFKAVPGQAAPSGGGQVRRLNPGEFIQNPDGSQSTELLITVTHPRLNGGRPTNIPSIWSVDGKPTKLEGPGSEDRAVEYALRAGEQWPSFNSIDEAVAAAQARSNGGGRFQDGAPPPSPPTLTGRQLQWSPSQQRFRDKATGEIFDVNGNPVR